MNTDIHMDALYNALINAKTTIVTSSMDPVPLDVQTQTRWLPIVLVNIYVVL